MAGLETEISVQDGHISITFSGYSSNLSDFMVEIIKRIKAFNPLKFEKEFVAIKNKWLKDKQNYYFNKPVA